MRNRLTQLLSALVVVSAGAAADGQAELESAFAAVEPRVIEWRRDLHANPELSNREFRTAEKVAAHLRDLGFDEVETGIAHTGVVGTLRGGKPGPVIALRADMDGLPVLEQTGLPFASQARGEYMGREVPVMHACGHDTHVAMLMGAAEVLARNRELLAGTVKFIFQPAEEGAPPGEEGGAELMVREGVLDGPDAPEAILGLHVWPDDAGSLGYRSGSFMAAADGIEIKVTGRQTHGSSPWLGVDPIYVSGQILAALQGIPGRHVDITRGPAVVTIGSIQGGVRGNIIPDDVTMLGTVRTFDMEERERLLQRLEATVTGIAEANGASATLTVTGSTPVTGNHPELLQTMMPTLVRAAGEDRVLERNLITGAEDFSYYQEKIPGLFLMLGVGDPAVPREERPSNHSPFFTAQEDALIVGVRTLVGFALDYPGQRL
ncbi:MAG: amidohydrolase [Haliea sp.]